MHRKAYILLTDTHGLERYTLDIQAALFANDAQFIWNILPTYNITKYTTANMKAYVLSSYTHISTYALYANLLTASQRKPA